MDKYILIYKKNNRYNKKIIYGYSNAIQGYNKLLDKAQNDETIKSGSLELWQGDYSMPYLLESF